MQFTVLIEFLVPGVATTLLALALLPVNSVPVLPHGIPTGDTAATLLLLAVSYPIGILTNFPVFLLLQKRLISSWGRRGIIARYKGLGVDLVKAGNQRFGISLGNHSGDLSREELRELFNLMRALVFRDNIDRLNSNHLYHEGLQRLARGMLLPLIMATVFVWKSQKAAWPALVVILIVFFIISLALLIHSIRTEEAQIAHFFLASIGPSLVQVPPPIDSASSNSGPGQEEHLRSLSSATSSQAS